MREEVLIIGCGEIGSLLIEGWLNKSKEFSKKISHINVLEKNISRENKLRKKYKKKISLIKKNKIGKFNKKFKYVFLSFKPKDLNSNLNFYSSLFDQNTIFYSVLAGKHISDIKKIFPINKNILRLMLNTPISVNEGTIVYNSLKKKVNNIELFLLNLLGKVYNLKKEKLFDLITAIVGSGPAFFYYLSESMEKAAVNYGLNKSLSKKVIKGTYVGTAKIISKLYEEYFK